MRWIRITSIRCVLWNKSQMLTAGPHLPLFGPLAGWFVAKQENIVKTDTPTGGRPALRCVISTAASRLCMLEWRRRPTLRKACRLWSRPAQLMAAGAMLVSARPLATTPAQPHPHSYCLHWEFGTAEGSHQARLRFRRRSRQNLSGLAGQNLRTSACPRVRGQRRGG